jgi:hypothetical protein
MQPNANDFDLVDEVFGRISDTVKAEGIGRLTAPEQLVYNVWGGLGILENGSFQYFFENGMDAAAVGKAIDTLGLSAVGDIFREAKQFLSKGCPQKQWAEQLRFLKENESKFDSLAKNVLKHNKDIEASVAVYIRSNGQSFQ